MPDAGEVFDEILGESGGLLQWVRRAFTGIDDSPAQLHSEIDRGIRTAGHKKQLLGQIDRLVASAKKARDGAPVEDAVTGALYAGIPAFVLSGGGAVPAAIGAGAAKAAFTSRNRRAGAIDRYIKALRDVRDRVESTKPEASHFHEEAVDLALLNEGLGGLVKHLAVGDIEGQVAGLKAEAKDVHSPAAQAMVLRKVVAMMAKLTAIRHGGAKLTAFVHDSAAWFQQHVEGRNAVTEINVRAGEALRDLAQIRDQVAAKRWDGMSQQQNDDRVEKLKAAAQESLERVAAKQDYEF